MADSLQEKIGKRRNDGVEVVVVAHEGVEGAQLHPAQTQFLCCVPVETAHVRAHHRHSEQFKGQYG